MSAPWYKCFPRDFNEGMVGLSLEERGAYVTILNLIYARGGPIPEDTWWITSQLGCTARTWTKIRAALILKRKLFEVQVGGGPHLMNQRASVEIAAREELSKNFSEAGARGGRNSTTKRNENKYDQQASLEPALSQPQALSDTDTDTDTDIPPSPLKGVEATSRRRPRKALPDGFPTTEAILEQQLKARSAGADLDVSAEAERFRNHALSIDRRCADWSGAWRNWVLKAFEWAPKLHVSPPADEAEANPWPGRLMRWRTSQYWNSEWGPKPGKPGYRGPDAQELAA